MVVNWTLIGIIFLVALAGSSIGFKYYIWFMSAGYGSAVAAVGVANIILMLTGKYNCVPTVVAQSLLFIIYGTRLCVYTMRRDLKNKDYVKIVRGEFSGDIPFVAKCGLWVYLSALYTAQTCGSYFRFYNNTNLGSAGSSVLHVIGIVISITGFLIEYFADVQKTASKNENPNMPAMTGLYKMCRCPNYFGEILFWTGHFIGALDILQKEQWYFAVIGEILICYIMFNGTQRLEKRQDSRYGEMPEYKEYIKKTPILLPVVPWYHTYDPAKEAAKKAAKEAKKSKEEKK